ncbi:MAG: DUF1361 domain-containing protein [Bacteroidales bacterium]|nr:DUF1361 domain-containing protein [Bacteroidales bacterium]
MLEILREKNRMYETVFMGVLTLLSLALSLFSFHYTGSYAFLFLNWNLFLAFVPWALTSVAIIRPGIQKSKIMIVLLLASWLLFFPNAPYILTDLFHLRGQSVMPVWFNLVLILSYAWTGLLFGFLSLWDMEQIFGKKMNPVAVKLMVSALLFLGSFGVYVGRFLRWNSWDVITEPFKLFYDISDRVANPFHHPRTWGMTLFLGLFLNMIYWSFRMVQLKVQPKEE